MALSDCPYSLAALLMKLRISCSLCRTVQLPVFPDFFPPLRFFFLVRSRFLASPTLATAVIAMTAMEPRAARRERQRASLREAVSNDSGGMPTPSLAGGRTPGERSPR
jgi:hypothetical protein